MRQAGRGCTTGANCNRVPSVGCQGKTTSKGAGAGSQPPLPCSELLCPLRSLTGSTEITGDLYLDTVVHADVMDVLEALTSLSDLSMDLASVSVEGEDSPCVWCGQGHCQICTLSACFLLLQGPSLVCMCTLCLSWSPTDTSARSFRIHSLRSTTISPWTLVMR